MTLKFNITANEGKPTSVTVFADRPLVATREHTNFDEIIEALGGSASDQDVIDLFDVSIPLARSFEALSERVAVANGRIYFDMMPVHNVLTETIVTFWAQGHEDMMALVNFMEKIELNPNDHSKEHLFRWLSKHSFAICPDGDFIAYKGVLYDGANEYKSISSGTAIVNGVVHEGRIPTQPGTIVEMPRDQVEHAPGVACSTGLHAGNWRYAKDFAQGAVLRVKINPRDVVSVPVDSNDEKLRVCRYRVLDKVATEDRSMLFVEEAMRTLCAAAAVRGRIQTTVKKKAAPAKKTPAKKPPVPAKKVAAKKAPVAAKKVAAKKAASPVKAVKRRYYEQFDGIEFGKRPVAELRWLAKEWEMKTVTPVDRLYKSVLVDLLADEAAKRTRKMERDAKSLAAGKTVKKVLKNTKSK